MSFFFGCLKREAFEGVGGKVCLLKIKENMSHFVLMKIFYLTKINKSNKRALLQSTQVSLF